MAIKPNTPALARQRADQIIADLAGDDPETAHSDQDKFYVDVLRSIADPSTGPTTAGALAIEALRVADAPGAGWYA